MKHQPIMNNLPSMQGIQPAVAIDKDLVYKPDYVTNSFFAIGNFDSKGHQLNYLYHVMTFLIPGQEPTVTYCFSVTDETTGQYYADTKTYPLDQATISEDIFYFEVPEGKIYGDIHKLRIEAKMTDHPITIDAELVPVGYPIFNGGSGKFHIVGMDVYEYSFPTLETTGVITIADEVYPLDGMSWYDRQWQRKLPPAPALKAMAKIMEFQQGKGGGANFTLPTWGWMDLNLDNGDVISTWFSIEEEGESAWATIMHQDGTQKKVAVEPIISKASKWFKSPDSDYSYPTEFQIIIPELDAELLVTASVENQELVFKDNPELSHYEGAARVKGSLFGKPVTGYNYIELIGPWYEDILERSKNSK